MIHGSAAQPSEACSTAIDRRDVDRLLCSAEVIISWNHDLQQRVRLRMIDISELGMRVSSTLPILEGMTGIALSLLPDGVDLHRVFTVRWVKLDEQTGEYTAGVRFLG